MVWRYAAAFAFIFALFGTSVAAAQDDLPGDVLYSVKVGSEQVRLGSDTNAKRTCKLYLDFAQRRLNECLALKRRIAALTGSLVAIKNEYTQAWDAISLVAPEDAERTCRALSTGCAKPAGGAQYCS